METFNHILVATDFADSSSKAVELAVTLASNFRAQLTLLHVCEIPAYPYAEPMLNPSNVAAMKHAAATRLAETLEQVKARIAGAQSVLEMGRPAEEILAAIDKLKPDLVVMGTHGRRGLSKVFFGSVAEKVVRLSPVAVLTTPRIAPEPSSK
jgi:nucleotide-binding universal stress UspA family protein